MGIGDRLKDLTRKAQDSAAEQKEQLVDKAQTAAVEHKEQLHSAVEKAQVAADRRTGGQYHEQILQAAAKVESYVDSLKPAGEREPPAAGPADAEQTSPRPPSGEPPRGTP